MSLTIIAPPTNSGVEIDSAFIETICSKTPLPKSTLLSSKTSQTQITDEFLNKDLNVVVVRFYDANPLVACVGKFNIKDLLTTGSYKNSIILPAENTIIAALVTVDVSIEATTKTINVVIQTAPVT